MGIVERQRHLAGKPHRNVDRELPFPGDPVAERLTLDERHREPEPVGDGARVIDAEDVRVLEPGGELDFPLEPLGAHRRREFRMEHLEGDRAVVLDIARQKHGRHATAPELAFDLVATREGRPQAFNRCRHQGRVGCCTITRLRSFGNGQPVFHHWNQRGKAPTTRHVIMTTTIARPAAAIRRPCAELIQPLVTARTRKKRIPCQSSTATPAWSAYSSPRNSSNWMKA